MSSDPHSGGSKSIAKNPKVEDDSKQQAQKPEMLNEYPNIQAGEGSVDPDLNDEASSSNSEVEAGPQKLTVGQRKSLKKSQVWRDFRARYDLSRTEMKDIKNRAKSLYPNQKLTAAILEEGLVDYLRANSGVRGIRE